MHDNVHRKLIFYICDVCRTTTYDGQTVTIAGWGLLTYGGKFPEYLQATQVTVTSLDYCKQQLQDSSLKDSQVCTTGSGQHDACQYDSGGPVMYYDYSYARYFGVGIISFGEACGINKPAVNTRVSWFNNNGWIKSNMPATQYTCQH